MPEFSPGLEGVVAAQTAVSEVDGANGRLIYRGGYLIEDLALAVTYEEVAYLLWHGELPDKAELDALRKQMASARALTKAARGALMSTEPATDPMDVLRTVVSAQGASKTLVKPTLDDAVALTAVFPTIVAAAHRRRLGHEVVDPRDDLSHAANLIWMMEGKEPDVERVHWVDSYLVLLADHGLNASTFAARVIASTGSDLTSSVVGAIGALKGPAHGGATFAARTMLDKIGSEANAEQWLREAHERHERFAGFGHRVYRTYDPRAKILREMAAGAAPELHRTAARTEELALHILHEAHPERPNATNVDFWASVVLTGAGIPKEMFTCMFATSRVVGWTAHVLESLADLRIIRPASVWIGPEPGKKPAAIAKR
ncbi:MAG TPA: citrate/2-methylcitrate synthase [Candidatus Dormibacteraeota bacterium]